VNGGGTKIGEIMGEVLDECFSVKSNLCIYSVPESAVPLNDGPG